MKNFTCVQLLSDPKIKPVLCSIFIAATIILGAYFIGSSLVAKDYKEQRLLRWETFDTMQKTQSRKTESNICKSRCRPPGSEALPEGIVAKASNLEMRPLWGSDMNNNNLKTSKSLLAMAVGIKQKKIVNQIVEKFLSSNFVVMLFHYDGVVDDWRDLAWSDGAMHVSGVNQTKWWFAKRFLHPDIVAEYNYIFLWDEDLGVENFDPGRYLSIIKDERLEISQPALDPVKSRVHHQITARLRRSKVHRRIFKLKGGERCDGNSTAPPCLGWVEMMAPVFSRKAWQCVWYMIQNDLIHAWGLDMQLGYCAQGDRSKNIGVVDSEYIVHLGLPTLGFSDENEVYNETHGHTSPTEHLSNSEAQAPSESHRSDDRPFVRQQSFIEMQIFKKRWIEAVKEDKCWVDQYKNLTNHSNH